MAAFRDAYAEYYSNGLKYEFITEISPKVWKISRKSDRMEYLAQDVTKTLFADVDGKSQSLTDYGHLLAPDGQNLLGPVKAVLNHPNLVSLVDCFALQFTRSGKVGRDQWFTVWDYCDAGNLGNLLVPSQPRPQDRDSSQNSDIKDEDTEMEDAVAESENLKFLPEAFCWHVLTSVLRALTWLHDGIYDIVQKEDGRWQRVSGDLDWQPMLHRDINPQNIFVGHPRRKEWYGPVKLGNYGSLFISGHCQTPGDKQAPTFSKVIAPPPGEKFARLEDLITFDTKHGSVYPHQPNQPYTMVSEYRALGEIMQAMMVEPTGSAHVQRIQSQPVRFNLQGLRYTGRLKNFVVKLMEFDAWRKTPVGKEPNPIYTTCELYREALLGVQWFMGTRNDEANNLVTPKMAGCEDFVDGTSLTAGQLSDSFKNVQEILEQFK
ncbi:hypothetical protein E0Z10_g577 [Xylaria hypoxylon]|uniref:non-specific serine/threonine protein kinase n=1 Tax=Xylaria hypoxylon TaxID=37992 RepID=A0A4Z0Z8Q1_9PEZI|nr:hypothetical protein E0Z10_g577 [Xylaria hypoxylon]